MAVYTNDDGLKIKFGTEQAEAALVGTVSDNGIYNNLVVDLDHSRMPAHTASDTLLSDLHEIALPAGAIITTATLDITEAFDSGGSATLDIGLEKADGTEYDYDGIDAAIAETAIDAVGDRVACDGALVGGAALTEKAFVTVNVGTATFTVGRGKLVIEYIIPQTF
jgi:hypothetical protein